MKVTCPTTTYRLTCDLPNHVSISVLTSGFGRRLRGACRGLAGASMATILDFPPAGGRTGQRVKGPARPASGEIVIFPGVRYERWESAPAKPAKSKASRKVKRDTLELKD